MTTAYDLIYETIGNEIHDETGTCYRVEDIRSVVKSGGYYEYMIGLKELGSLWPKQLIYINLDRYDELCQQEDV